MNVVPINLGAIRSDEMRRRLASKLLVRAIDLAIAERGMPATGSSVAISSRR